MSESRTADRFRQRSAEEIAEWPAKIIGGWSYKWQPNCERFLNAGASRPPISAVARKLPGPSTCVNQTRRDSCPEGLIRREMLANSGISVFDSDSRANFQKNRDQIKTRAPRNSGPALRGVASWAPFLGVNQCGEQTKTGRLLYRLFLRDDDGAHTQTRNWAPESAGFFSLFLISSVFCAFWDALSS